MKRKNPKPIGSITTTVRAHPAVTSRQMSGVQAVTAIVFAMTALSGTGKESNLAYRAGRSDIEATGVIFISRNSDMAKTHKVSFKANKKVSAPVKVDFETKSGKEVKFPAHKTVQKKVPVSFRAKNK